MINRLLQRKLGLFFVFVGFFFFLYPILFLFSSENEKKSSINLTIFSVAPVIEEKKPEKLEEKKELKLKEEEEFKIKPEDFILEIKTEKLNIRAPIVEGVKLKDLEKGVGHHPETALPGSSGNVVLSGHRWYSWKKNPYHRIFYDLDKLEIGDRIFIYYQKERFIYQVFERKVILPTQTEILNQTEEPILTLYTCTPLKTNYKRLVYQAKLIAREIVSESEYLN